MKGLRLAVVVVILSSGLAWATDLDTVASTLKNFGINYNDLNSKKPCACRGGADDREMGLVEASPASIDGGHAERALDALIAAGREPAPAEAELVLEKAP